VNENILKYQFDVTHRVNCGIQMRRLGVVVLISLLLFPLEFKDHRVVFVRSVITSGDVDDDEDVDDDSPLGSIVFNSMEK